MRRMWVAGLTMLVALCAGVAAQSQDGAPPAVAYERRYTAEDIIESFPAPAYRNRQDGQASLCCLVRGDGSLQCAAVAEEPAGRGFGEAARRVSFAVRLTDESAEAWRAYGQPLRLRISFRGQGFRPAPEFVSAPRCGIQTRETGDDAVISAENESR